LSNRYRADELVIFASALLEQAGMARDRARTVADVIVEADLLGHDTHGLDQLAGYLVQIEEGRLVASGDPQVVADLGACLTWDGRRLPGHRLVKQAIAEARHRILAHPIVTVVIGRGYHIGCLQAYLKPVTDAGFIILLMCSDPSASGVAPHGGVASRITPNPIAATRRRSHRGILASVYPAKPRWPAEGARFAKGSSFMRTSCRH
jgi:LDH2 family malate/lactate/ureidoglycolate dehydrogenase